MVACQKCGTTIGEWDPVAQETRCLNGHTVQTPSPREVRVAEIQEAMDRRARHAAVAAQFAADRVEYDRRHGAREAR